MNATLAFERIRSGWPELIPADFPRDELLLLVADHADFRIADAEETARTEGYNEAEKEYKPDADKRAEAEEQRDAAIERADRLQTDLDATLDGDTSALWAAKLNALRSEVLQHLEGASRWLEPERKASGRRAHLLTLRRFILESFAAATPASPHKN